MARKLRKFEFTGHGAGRRRYPWNDWTDGSIWEITRPEDFDVIPENLRTMMYAKARDLDLRLHSNIVDANTFVFQFYKRED
jgi:hypothetical protein